MSLDTTDIHRQRDSLHMMAGNLMNMLEACRSQSKHRSSGYTTSVVSMTANSFRNALDAMQATITEVETECLLICIQREIGNPVYDLSQRLPSPRPSAGLPVVGSFAAE